MQRILAPLDGADDFDKTSRLALVSQSSPEAQPVVVVDGGGGGTHQPSMTSHANEMWLLQECARFCVASSLRTPFGKPNQTLEVIDQAIREIVVQLDAKIQATVTLAAPVGSIALAAAQQERQSASAIRQLMFLEVLERHFINAADGSAKWPAAASTARVFFRANRAVGEISY